jgi:hypothetical protein
VFNSVADTSSSTNDIILEENNLIALMTYIYLDEIILEYTSSILYRNPQSQQAALYLVD